MNVPKPTWTTASFLLYAGALTVLVSAVAALEYLHRSYGQAAWVGWSALVLAILAAIAIWFRRRGHWLTAGLFAVATLAAWGLFAGALERWWGWLPATSTSAFSGFHAGLLLLELLIVAGAVVELRGYRFPLLVLPACVAAWLFVTDLVSNGGGWSAIVTIVVGLGYLLAGSTLDHGPRRPYGFWLHLVAGFLIGGSLLFFWHSGDFKWALLAIGALVFISLAASTGRSSWAVLGTVGLLLSAGHFAIEWTRVGYSILFAGVIPSSGSRGWVPPLVYAFVGFLLVALGLLVGRRRALLRSE
ncbi:MAG: hypothetical protein QOD48_1085 [Gaiellaceae bacterium]|nr:hypothetical protein [Gaiellaceae bacterium]